MVEIGMSSVDCLPDENPDTKDGASNDREDDGKEDADEEREEGPDNEDQGDDEDVERVEDEPRDHESSPISDGAGHDHEGEDDVGGGEGAQHHEDHTVVIIDQVNHRPHHSGHLQHTMSLPTMTADH